METLEKGVKCVFIVDFEQVNFSWDGFLSRILQMLFAGIILRQQTGKFRFGEI